MSVTSATSSHNTNNSSGASNQTLGNLSPQVVQTAEATKTQALQVLKNIQERCAKFYGQNSFNCFKAQAALVNAEKVRAAMQKKPEEFRAELENHICVIDAKLGQFNRAAAAAQCESSSSISAVASPAVNEAKQKSKSISVVSSSNSPAVNEAKKKLKNIYDNCIAFYKKNSLDYFKAQAALVDAEMILAEMEGKHKKFREVLKNRFISLNEKIDIINRKAAVAQPACSSCSSEAPSSCLPASSSSSSSSTAKVDELDTARKELKTKLRQAMTWVISEFLSTPEGQNLSQTCLKILQAKIEMENSSSTSSSFSNDLLYLFNINPDAMVLVIAADKFSLTAQFLTQVVNRMIYLQSKQTQQDDETEETQSKFYTLSKNFVEASRNQSFRNLESRLLNSFSRIGLVTSSAEPACSTSNAAAIIFSSLSAASSSSSTPVQEGEQAITRVAASKSAINAFLETPEALALFTSHYEANLKKFGPLTSVSFSTSANKEIATLLEQFRQQQKEAERICKTLAASLVIEEFLNRPEYFAHEMFHMICLQSKENHEGMNLETQSEESFLTACQERLFNRYKAESCSSAVSISK